MPSLISILCLAVWTWTSPAAAQRPSNDVREVSASPGEKLILDLETGGSVSVKGWSRNAVSVAVNQSGGEADVEVGRTSAGVQVRARRIRIDRSGSPRLRFLIRVPTRFDVALDSLGGSLEIDDVEGHFTGKTMGGELRLVNVSGRADLTTMGGDITLTDADLDGSLTTMGGEVLLHNVIGDVRGVSMGGNVRYENVRRRHGEPASPPGLDNQGVLASTVQIATMGGDIVVDEAPSGARVHTMGGDIEIRAASRFVDAQTMGGDIDIESADGWIKAVTMSGNVRAAITSSSAEEREIELSTMSGSVVLFLPDGFPLRLDAEIRYTRNSSQDFRIESDFPVRQRRTADWDYDEGSPSKKIRATTGAAGAPNVRIRVVNGNIRLKKR